MAANAKKKVVKKTAKKKVAPKHDEYTLFYDGQELGSTKGGVQFKVAEPIISDEPPTMRKKWWQIFRRKAPITRETPAQWWGDYVILRVGQQNLAVPRRDFERWHDITEAWGVAEKLASGLKELSEAAERDMLDKRFLGVVK